MVVKAPTKSLTITPKEEPLKAPTPKLDMTETIAFTSLKRKREIEEESPTGAPKTDKKKITLTEKMFSRTSLSGPKLKPEGKTYPKHLKSKLFGLPLFSVKNLLRYKEAITYATETQKNELFESGCKTIAEYLGFFLTKEPHSKEFLESARVNMLMPDHNHVGYGFSVSKKELEKFKSSIIAALKQDRELLDGGYVSFSFNCDKDTKYNQMLLNAFRDAGITLEKYPTQFYAFFPNKGFIDIWNDLQEKHIDVHINLRFSSAFFL